MCESALRLQNYYLDFKEFHTLHFYIYITYIEVNSKPQLLSQCQLLFQLDFNFIPEDVQYKKHCATLHLL